MFILDGTLASLGVGAGTGNVGVKKADLANAKSELNSLESQKAEDKSSSGSSQTVTGGNQSTEVSAPRSSGSQVGQGRIDEATALVAQLESEIGDMRGQASTEEGQKRANNQTQVKQSNAAPGT